MASRWPGAGQPAADPARARRRGAPARLRACCAPWRSSRSAPSLLEFVLEYAQALVTTYIGQRVMHDLRLEIFEHLQRLSIPYFDRNPVGRLMTRVTSDVETLNELFSSGVVTVFGDLFTLAAIMALMLVADWRLALVAFSVIPLVYLLAAASSGAGCARRSGISGSAWRGSTAISRNTSPACAWCSSSRREPASAARVRGASTRRTCRRTCARSPSTRCSFPPSRSSPRSRWRWCSGTAACGPSAARSPSACWRRSSSSRAGSSSRCRTSPRSSTSCRAPWRRRSGSSACSTSR